MNLKSPIVNITQSAFKKMNNILSKSDNKIGFLFGITSGGCNGFNFNLNLMSDNDFNKIIKMKPSIIENNDLKVYIDPIAEMHLIGTTIDYVSEDISKGIFENKFVYKVDKKLASSCGCGVSFMPRSIKWTNFISKNWNISKLPKFRGYYANRINHE